ncbi:hypothetical protein JW905_10730 [bacterium]|nr:hypothetical protein [candidate division CSSED10-310 bacterium]
MSGTARAVYSAGTPCNAAACLLHSTGRRCPGLCSVGIVVATLTFMARGLAANLCPAVPYTKELIAGRNLIGYPSSPLLQPAAIMVTPFGGADSD